MPADVLVTRSREVNTVFADSGVSTLEALQAKRAALATANAALWARYGDGGTFGQKRDNLYALIAIEKRRELEAPDPQSEPGKIIAPKKVTEAMVDAAVRIDPRYAGLIDEAEQERARFYLNNNAIKDLDEKMFRDNAVIRYLTTEPKL
jgi:hypothetical protein